MLCFSTWLLVNEPKFIYEPKHQILVHFAAGILFFKIKFTFFLKKGHPWTPGALDKATPFLLATCSIPTPPPPQAGVEKVQDCLLVARPPRLCAHPAYNSHSLATAMWQGTNGKHFIMLLSVFTFITRNPSLLYHHSTPVL